jgi:hypothetical protein
MQFGDRGLTQIMNYPQLGPARANETRDRIAPLMTALVERAQQQGVVRPDFDQTDLIFIQMALSAVTEGTRALAPDLYRRYLTLFLDGIRADAAPLTPMPAQPLSASQVHALMTQKLRKPGDPDSRLPRSAQHPRIQKNLYPDRGAGTRQHLHNHHLKRMLWSGRCGEEGAP